MSFLSLEGLLSTVDVCEAKKDCRFEHLDNTVSEILERFNVPGISIGVVADGKCVLARSYGMRNLAEGLLVNEETMFPIASCTKAFTALLLGQLVDESKLSWDDPVKKYIPEFHLSDIERTENLTIRDLLAHRTGIARHDPIWFFDGISEQDVFKILANVEPACGLREEFQYNNFMYTVAGIVVERITGKQWTEAVKARIFNPLGMKHSTAVLEESHSTSNFSLPYASVKDILRVIPFRSTSPVKPASGLNSNMMDMLQWVEMLLSHGKLKGVQLIKDETLREMYTLQIHLKNPINIEDRIFQLGYGLGWSIGSYRGRHLVRHGGDIDGFASEVSLLPEKDLGVVILANTSSDGREAIASIRNMIFDSYLDAADMDWIGKFYSDRAKIKQALHDALQEGEKIPPERALQEYVGDYLHPAYGVIQILVQNDRLLASYNQSVFHLDHREGDLFLGKWYPLLYYAINPNIDFCFSMNESGAISAMHVPFEAFRSAKEIVFQKINNQ